jgi:hypothetical protein
MRLAYGPLEYSGRHSPRNCRTSFHQEGEPMSRYRIRARVAGGAFVTVTGRDADTLEKLKDAGPRGLTPIDYPAPRWSHYVFKLRRAGFNIETIDEAHSGPFAGTHARYVLRSDVEILPFEEERRAA